MFAHGLPRNGEGALQPAADSNLLARAADSCQASWRGFLTDLGTVSRALTRTEGPSGGEPAGAPHRDGSARRQRRRRGGSAPLCCLSESLAEGLQNVGRFPAEGRLHRGLKPVLGDLADGNVLRSPEAGASASGEDSEREERILISEVGQETPLARGLGAGSRREGVRA